MALDLMYVYSIIIVIIGVVVTENEQQNYCIQSCENTNSLLRGLAGNFNWIVMRS